MRPRCIHTPGEGVLVFCPSAVGWATRSDVPAEAPQRSTDGVEPEKDTLVVTGRLVAASWYGCGCESVCVTLFTN